MATGNTPGSPRPRSSGGSARTPGTDVPRRSGSATGSGRPPRVAENTKNAKKARTGGSGSGGRGAGGRGTGKSGGTGESPSRAPVVRKGWGSVARRGASTVRAGSDGHGPDRDTPEGRRRSKTRPDQFVEERWVRTDDRRRSKAPGIEAPLAPAHRAVRAPAELQADIANELATAAGPDWNHLRDRITERMAAGIGAYQRERYRDASRILKTVVDAVPNSASARELLGLSQYHQSYWKAALPNLEAFAALTGSVDQHPVRMDCQRALGRPKRVEALFIELRKGSPDPEVLAEGRMVLAGTRADNGDLGGAINLLVEAGAGRLVRNPADRHLRQWYVLGDLTERSGDLPKARELFLRIVAVEPDAYDVADRLESLGPPAKTRKSPNRSRTAR
jgi:Tetratricopeptide repeat